MQLTTSAVATGTVAMATVLKQQAKAGRRHDQPERRSNPTTFFGPNYLHWTFSQDFYNYSPYLAQVCAVAPADVPVQRDALEQPALHRPVQPGERHAERGDPQRASSTRCR